MAETGKRADPLGAFRFQVEIEGMKAGFSECSGLGLETEIFEYSEGGVNSYVHQFPTRVKLQPVVLRRGVVDTLLWDWYARTRPGAVELKSGSIVLLDEDEKYWLTWRFERAYPRRVQGPELKASQAQVAVETLELVHHGLTLEQDGTLEGTFG